jgi:hypothetical protein
MSTSYLSELDSSTGIEVLQMIHETTGVETFQWLTRPTGIEVLLMLHENIGTEVFQWLTRPTGIEVLQMLQENLGTEVFQMGHESTPTEILQMFSVNQGIEVLLKIYNTTNIRILCEFASRGTVDENWTVIQGGTATGDFGVNNINTDIPEEVYRSQNLFVTLDCDAGKPQGISPDTWAIWNHNLTSGAVVTVVASNDPGFGSALYSFQMTYNKNNMFFITSVEDFPYPLARYFRWSIVDVDNPDGYIEIGNILFGSAVVFHNDCITSNVTRRYTEFKDEIPTEGFTTITNPRTLKTAISLEFRDLSFGRFNYTNLVNNVFLDARTSLRCLWIPYMEQPARFAVFGKLTELPVEEHNVMGDANEDLDFVTFNVDIDESL